MAASTSELDKSSETADTTLTENDIPGASLQPPFEKHTVSELRWWLLCRGLTVSTSMKKGKIIDK